MEIKITFVMQYPCRDDHHWQLSPFVIWVEAVFVSPATVLQIEVNWAVMECLGPDVSQLISAVMECLCPEGILAILPRFVFLVSYIFLIGKIQNFDSEFDIICTVVPANYYRFRWIDAGCALAKGSLIANLREMLPVWCLFVYIQFKTDNSAIIMFILYLQTANSVLCTA